jgi:phosphate transport system permease protein
MAEESYTGITRRRTTKLSVKLIDRAAEGLITVGGIGTIVAVLMIMLFLVWIVLPLFTGGSLKATSSTARLDTLHPIRMGIDEYRVMGWTLTGDGRIAVYRVDTGELLETLSPFPDAPPTATAMAQSTPEVVFGFADGSIVLGRLEFEATFLEESDVPKEIRGLPAGTAARLGKGMVQRTPKGQYRIQSLTLTLDEPAGIDPPSAIRRINLTMKPTGPVFAALTEDSRLILKEAIRRRNFLTGKTTVRFSGSETAVQMPGDRAPPDRLLLSDGGRFTYLIWRDGFLARFASAGGKEPVITEMLDLLPVDGEEVTAAGFLVGKTSLVIGDSSGRARIWYPVKPETSETLDGTVLVNAHELRAGSNGSAITALGPSTRKRLVAVGTADGAIRLYHVTSENLVAELPDAMERDSVLALTITPKEDGIVALGETRIGSFAIDVDHPDISLGALFIPTWYEGYAEPEHVWQSTGGTDDFEPKFGLMPLVFGTLKATLYSMLFGLPIALLAAIFTSEFLHPRVKSKIKPTIEIMASLPSVVLGFLSALVIAPFVEDIIPTCLTSFLTVPLAFMLGAYCWQLLPKRAALRLNRFRLLFMTICFPAGVLLAAWLGPVLESLFFAGDMKLWLDGQAGSGFGGWFFILLPAVGVVAALVLGRGLSFVIAPLTADWDRFGLALFDLGRFVAGLLLTVLIALFLAWVLTELGADPRGSFLGTYVQRNALVVGFVMGFAIIPIIFTIAEDALSAVPEHLRSASLGAGATPWQTATRIVVPTAMSGLFSAVMIGLGRAVGETMIVLMAAGNTPIMEWNIFNGFRTLSANLAVELPEAVRDSTHYRSLFFAALTLFAMTFVVNTLAEVVRLRFRKKAVQL